MSGPTSGPAAYDVSYPLRVRERLAELTAEARGRGDEREFLTALREFDRRLKLYPQFGDPLFDLAAHTGQVRIGVVPPLAMRYAVLEELRQVFVAALPVLLSKRHDG